jgi:hypothetical protein
LKTNIKSIYQRQELIKLGIDIDNGKLITDHIYEKEQENFSQCPCGEQAEEYCISCLIQTCKVCTAWSDCSRCGMKMCMQCRGRHICNQGTAPKASTKLKATDCLDDVPIQFKKQKWTCDNNLVTTIDKEIKQNKEAKQAKKPDEAHQGKTKEDEAHPATTNIKFEAMRKRILAKEQELTYLSKKPKISQEQTENNKSKANKHKDEQSRTEYTANKKARKQTVSDAAWSSQDASSKHCTVAREDAE